MSGEGGEGDSGGEGPVGAPPRPERPGNTPGGIEEVTRELEPEDLDEPESYETPEAGPDKPDSLEDALAGEIEPEPEPTAEEEPAEEPEGEAPEEPEGQPTRYRDPETGQFISAEKAQEKGLDLDELKTLEGEAEEFFGEGEEGEEPEAPEDTEEPEVEPVELELGEDETLEIAAEDEETRQHLEKLKEDAETGRKLQEERAEIEEAKEEIQADRRELDLIENALQEDPAAFMLSNVGEDHRQAVLRDLLLLDDELATEAQQMLNDWSRDPKERELQKERRRRERTETEYETGKRTPKAQAEKKRAETAKQVIGEIQSFIPEDADPDRADRFIHDAVEDVKAYIARNEMYPSDFDMEQVPELIEHRLELYGYERQEEPDNPTDVPEAEPATEDAKELSERTQRYRETGERLRKARARRRSAATTPAGAGGTPSRPAADMSDATLDEALDAAERAAG